MRIGVSNRILLLIRRWVSMGLYMIAKIDRKSVTLGINNNNNVKNVN